MYQVWIKEEFSVAWQLTDCDTLEDVRDAYLSAMKQAQPILVTRRMLVHTNVVVQEDSEEPETPPRRREPRIRRERRQEGKDETPPGGSESDQGSGDEGNGPV